MRFVLSYLVRGAAAVARPRTIGGEGRLGGDYVGRKDGRIPVQITGRKSVRHRTHVQTINCLPSNKRGKSIENACIQIL